MTVSRKQLLTSLNIPNCEHAIVDIKQLPSVVDALGDKLVLKASRDGYDGYGQWRLSDAAQLGELQASLADLDLKGSLVVEKMTQFDRELSLLGARNPNGEIVFYPLAENLHLKVNCISVAPAPSVSATLQTNAESQFVKLAEALDYVGVLAVEFFQYGDQLLVNELTFGP